MRRLQVTVIVSALVLLAATVTPAAAAPSPPHPRPHRTPTMNIAVARTKEVATGRVGRSAPQASHLAAGLQSAARSAKPVEVDVHGDVARSVAAVQAAGGQVRATATGALTATIAGDRLAAVAAAAGVSEVTVPERPVDEAAPSQGVGLSMADAWQSAGLTGTGVKIAIIDDGFQNLPAGIAAAQTNYCVSPNADPHGSAVAEIVHEMAPNAQIYLYCVDTSVEVNTAEQAITHLGGVKAINSSLGWPGDGRGDGTGVASSVAHAVHDARLHNILWVNSAGNEAQDHWSGTLADANSDSLVDLNGANINNESDEVFVAPGGPASVVMSWDNWPTSNLNVALELFGYQCPDAKCATFTPLNSLDQNGNPIPLVVQQAPGTPPFLGADISNGSGQLQFWDVYIGTAVPEPTVRYDLSWLGDVSPSYLSSVNSTRAAQGSIDPVAQSPDAMAVGAVDASGANACADSTTTKTVTNLPLEQYSSQGPTIDGRPKPDIVAYDGTTSGVFGSPFCGTSAASPHVAGAAALVAQAHPTFNAGEIESFLEQRANQGAPTNPAGDALGHGVLTLGQTGTAGTCSVSVPAQVYIGASATTITAQSGSDCAAAGMAAAQWNIVPSNASAEFQFHGGTSTASYVFHDSLDTVGVLQVQPGGASTSSGYDVISQGSAVFSAKYISLVYSASQRSGAAVYVNGFIHQWSSHGQASPSGDALWLQRYIGGGWQTMLARTTVNGHVTVGFVQRAVYQYRWVVLETSTAWSGYSASTIR